MTNPFLIWSFPCGFKALPSRVRGGLKNNEKSQVKFYIYECIQRGQSSPTEISEPVIKNINEANKRRKNNKQNRNKNETQMEARRKLPKALSPQGGCRCIGKCEIARTSKKEGKKTHIQKEDSPLATDKLQIEFDERV